MQDPAAQRARLAAVRGQVLQQMEYSTLRRRLTWLAAFNLLVAVVLSMRGAPLLHAGIQIGSLAVCVAMTFARRQATTWSFFWFAAHYFVGIAMTGALLSPLIPLCFPMVAAASIVLDSQRARIAIGATYILGFALLAIDSHGRAVQALPDYYLIAGVSLAVAIVGVLRAGVMATTAYTEIALELAARREELFVEGEDYARSLEGVAARLAHEVKNPLAAIRGLSTHMARSAQDAKTAQRLGIVAQEAERLQGIVDGFLGFSRGLDDLKPTTVRPWDIARELVLLLETRADDVGVAVEVLGDERAEVVADARKLRQALLNIVLNALQASPRGSKVTIAVARSAPDRVRIRVVDRGAGMTKQVLERIQKPYFTTRPGGSGLGLAIARALVDQHGGELLIDSEANKGTTVTIELPTAGPVSQAKLPGMTVRNEAPAP